MGSNDPASGENLLNLSDTSESRVLSEIGERFINKRIYTNVGGVLLSINPYEKYSIYDESVIAQYQQLNRFAHIFTPARCALENIQGGSNMESIVFSGESSSGKSFNAYQVMKYLATSRNSKVTVKHIDAITTIFNSFACAKTVKNENATRFGCCLDFLYHKNILSGLSLRSTLPLETIRVVSQKLGERNFNVFYELCSGLSSDAKAGCGIREQQKFFYLTQGKVAENVRDDATNFARLDSSLEIVGFSDEQRQIIYKTLATILHLGNMYFRQRRNTEDGTEYVEVSNDVELKWASYLLDVDMCSFAPCFTHKITKTNESTTKVAYSMGQALDARDALAMTLYEVVFGWILNRISLHLKCSDHSAVISVVDCYGIERYNNNGLEQLLINSVNEKLENAFVRQTFLNELTDYANEGLTFNWKMPTFLDNERVLELLCKKPYGLLHLIDDECKFPKASDESYLRHCNLNHLDKSIYGKAKNKERLQMSVRHSFGSTWYSVHGFVQRNKRVLPGNVVKILAESQNPVVSMLFRPLLNGKDGMDYVVYAAQQFNIASSNLVEKILSGQCHFVRCVRSNNERLPAHLDEPALARQVKALSIIETLKFRQAGFPVRIPFERFAKNYRCLLPSDIALCQKQKEIIIDILDGQGIKFADDHRIGANYVFMRDRLAVRLQALREKTQREAAYVIQKTMRAYVARKGYLRKRRAIIRLQAGLRGWKARKECCALREQMFRNLSNQTKRNRRLNAYHETFLSDIPEQRCTAALLGCLDVESSAKREIEKSLHDRNLKTADMKTTTEYLPMRLKNKLSAVTPVPIEKFAAEIFRGHLLEPRREPILTPFLHKENDIDFRLSIEIFKLILKYMNDQSLNRQQLNDLARYIVKQGILSPCQRDEIFVQICNQLYKNPDKEASSRCFRLLLQAVGVFAPSETVLPMLISFASLQRQPLRNQLVNTIAWRMNIIENQHAVRLLPASRLEMGAIYGFHNPAVEVATQEGDTHVVEAHSWITNEDLANRVLRHRGIGNPSGWTVEIETEKTLYCPTGAHFLHDIIAEIELGKEENKRSFFHNYSTERTLPPVNKTKATPPADSLQNRILSPLVKRSMRQISDTPDLPRHNRSVDATNMSRGDRSRERSRDALRVANVAASPPPYRQTYRGVEDQDDEYCYAMPVKPRAFNDSITRPNRVPYGVHPAEHPQEVPPELPTQPVPGRSGSRYEPPPHRPVHSQQRPSSSHDYAHGRPETMASNQYYAQTTIPMVQYVPVVMAPQHIPMFSTQVSQPLVQSPVLMPASTNQSQQSQPVRMYEEIQQDRIASQLSHQRDLSSHSLGKSDSEDRSRDYGAARTIPRLDFDSVRSRSSVATRNGECDSRMLNSRCDQVPSVYSTMSVASRIRSMPVPNNNRDVDRFLDEVFDQVLSPHELSAVEMSSQQIAATIKGGVFAPVDHESHQKLPTHSGNYSRIPYSQSGVDSNSYDYMNRESMIERGMPRLATRSQSAPRYGTVDRAYRHVAEDSSDSFASDVCTMREYMPSSQGTPSAQRSARPQAGFAKAASGVCEPQQMVFMMPMQLNASNGQMIPMLMPASMLTSTTAQNMMYCLPPSRQGVSPSRERRHRSVDAALIANENEEVPHYHAYQNSSLSSDFHPRNQSFEQARSMLRPEETGSIPRPLPRSPSPAKSPLSERRPNGLTRLPQDAYREPVVQNTIVNSEHPNPRKLKVLEKNLVKEIQQKEQEALRKINERMKNLPPPVDHVRIYLPKTRKAPTPFEAFAVAVPEEPAQYYEHQRQDSLDIESEEPQSEWVFEGEVERPVEVVEGRHTPSTPARYTPQPVQQPAEPEPSQERPAVRYVKQPWKLTIRKEMFHPQEQLDDVQVINQVFSQIISDCRKGIAYRIRAYERDDVVNILKSNNIPPDMLNHQSQIPIDIKVAVIEAARKWPLYFAQIYEVVEERLDESVSVLLALGEHGVRLLLHTPLDKENPLKSQDHFQFADMNESTLEGDDVLCLHARNHMTIRLRTKMAPQIKSQIDKCMYGQMQRKQFVRATADYVTKQPNLLSFKKGDTIELVPLPNGEVAPSGSWLYGKIGNRYGSLPAQYVVPLDDKNREVEESVPPLPLVYEDVGDEIGHLNGYKYTMMEFAVNHFRGPKGFENTLKKNKKDWTWHDVAERIKFTDKPISHSLIRFESGELDKLACETFSCIMRYMGDEPIRRGETMTDAVYRVLLICHKHPPMRDEVYCQIIRQTTNNKSSKPDSSIRGWRLFSIITAYFDCSLSLRPYLINYLGENADDHRRAYHGTAQLCLQNLQQTMRYGGRKYLLSGMEVEEITNGKILKRQTYVLPGGSRKVVNTKSITVVEEAIRELCAELNIRSPSEQQEFCLCYVLEKESRVEYCNNDDYILDICTELEHKRQQFHFLLKRCTWVHPLRLDHPVYIDVMFFQIVADYMKGMFITKHAAGHLSAATCEDVATLAAYLHIAAGEGKTTAVTAKHISSVVPSAALEYPSQTPETWASRINRQLRTMNVQMTSTQARAAFLELLSTWTLFGSTIFRLDGVFCDGRDLSVMELAVCRNGVKLLEPRSRDVFDQWTYDKIVSTKTGDAEAFVEMVVSGPSSSRVYEFRTKECSSLVRLVAQYNFIVEENRGLLND